MKPRNFSRELRRARARIRYLEAENAMLYAKLKARDLAPAPGALGVYRGARPVGIPGTRVVRDTLRRGEPIIDSAGRYVGEMPPEESTL